MVVLRVRDQARRDVTEQMRVDLNALIDRHEPFALIYDVTDVEIPPRDQIMEIMRWTRDLRERFASEFEQVTPRIPTFTAYHMPSAVGNLLRFILQMMPSLRSQYVVCTTFDEAMAACEEAIVRLGISDQQSPRRAG
ncbi:hypothetical protein DB30_04921 [Enhygromyxa salina]|uniref:Uncharacterized protein n=1 Tax=Enhygromyxa salina TaxID=215803 RepID=A0A0C1ZEF2_9BACT|nr:hypothetical protein DB30_04921 [Enhygromyxa salina]